MTTPEWHSRGHWPGAIHQILRGGEQTVQDSANARAANSATVGEADADGGTGGADAVFPVAGVGQSLRLVRH